MTVYTKQLWADNDASKPVSAARMLHLEDGIEAVDLAVDALTASLAAEVSLSDGRLDAIEARKVKRYRMTADTAFTAVTYGDLTGLTAIPLAASTRYRVRAVLVVTDSLATVGPQVRVQTATTTISESYGRVTMVYSGNPGPDGLWESDKDLTLGVGATPGVWSGAGDTGLVIMEGYFLTNATPGTMKLQGRIASTTGSGTVTFKTAGSFVELEPLLFEN